MRFSHTSLASEACASDAREPQSEIRTRWNARCLLDIFMSLERLSSPLRRSLWVVLASTAPLMISASADPTTATVEVEAIRADARRASADGRFETASTLYQALLKRNPRDPDALREGGRAAHANRDFATAAALLGRAAAITTSPDPELH